MSWPDEARCTCPAATRGGHTLDCMVSLRCSYLAAACVIRGELTRTVEEIVDDTIEELTSDDVPQTPTLRDRLRRFEREDRQYHEITRILRALDCPIDIFRGTEPGEEISS